MFQKIGKKLFEWMNNIQDYVLADNSGGAIEFSWYDDQKIYVGKNENDIREKYDLNEDIVLPRRRRS